MEDITSIDVKAEDKEDDGGEGDDGSDHDLAIKVVAIFVGTKPVMIIVIF